MTKKNPHLRGFFRDLFEKAIDPRKCSDPRMKRSPKNEEKERLDAAL
jgi:hypothetical protein